jgi:hypothetical protein
MTKTEEVSEVLPDWTDEMKEEFKSYLRPHGRGSMSDISIIISKYGIDSSKMTKQEGALVSRLLGEALEEVKEEEDP